MSNLFEKNIETNIEKNIEKNNEKNKNIIDFDDYPLERDNNGLEFLSTADLFKQHCKKGSDATLYNLVSKAWSKRQQELVEIYEHIIAQQANEIKQLKSEEMNCLSSSLGASSITTPPPPPTTFQCCVCHEDLSLSQKVQIVCQCGPSSSSSCIKCSDDIIRTRQGIYKCPLCQHETNIVELNNDEHIENANAMDPYDEEEERKEEEHVSNNEQTSANVVFEDSDEDNNEDNNSKDEVIDDDEEDEEDDDDEDEKEDKEPEKKKQKTKKQYKPKELFVNVLINTYMNDKNEFILNGKVLTVTIPSIERIKSIKSCDNLGELDVMIQQNKKTLGNINFMMLCFRYEEGVILTQMKSIWNATGSQIFQVKTFKEYIKKIYPSDSYDSVDIKIRFAELVEKSKYFVLNVNREWSFFSTRLRKSSDYNEMINHAKQFVDDVKRAINDGRVVLEYRTAEYMNNIKKIKINPLLSSSSRQSL